MTKRSAIWKIDKEELRKIVADSKSIRDILKHFSMESKGGNYKTLKTRLKADDINFDHIPLGRNSNSGRIFNREQIPLNLILVKNSTYNRYHLKIRLIKDNILQNICSICGQLPEWNGKPLSLQIDHINGISNDNRIENLRILCPHCHSQTDNFAGKHTKILRHCSECGNLIHKRSKKCRSCSSKSRDNKFKINWPTIEELKELLSISSYSSVGRKLGVSDTAIRKRLKKYS